MTPTLHQKKIICVTIGFIQGVMILLGQNTLQQGYWIRLYTRVNLSGKWSLHLELDERRFIEPGRQLQFITHLHAHRKIGKSMELSVGSSYSIVNKLSEWRPFQEWHYWKSMGQKWRISGRFRTEQRLMEKVDQVREWRFRTRSRLQIDYSLTPKWVFKVSDEIMWHTDGFDQNRVYIAVERRFVKKISWEIGYLRLRQKRAVQTSYKREFLRSTIFLNF